MTLEKTIEELIKGKNLTYPQFEKKALKEILTFPSEHDFLQFCQSQKNNQKYVDEIFFSLTTEKYSQSYNEYFRGRNIISLLEEEPNYPFSVSQYRDIFDVLAVSQTNNIQALRKHKKLPLPDDFRAKVLNFIMSSHNYRDYLLSFLKAVKTITKEERELYLQYILNPPILNNQYTGSPFEIQESLHGDLAANYLIRFQDDKHRSTLFDICFKGKPTIGVNLIKGGFKFSKDERERILDFIAKRPSNFIHHGKTIRKIFNSDSEFDEYRLNSKPEVIEKLARKKYKELYHGKDKNRDNLIIFLNNNDTKSLIDDKISKHLENELDVLRFIANLKIIAIIDIVNNENKDLLQKIVLNENLIDIATSRLKNNCKDRSSSFINEFISKVEQSNVPKERIEKTRATLVMKLLTNI